MHAADISAFVRQSEAVERAITALVKLFEHDFPAPSGARIAACLSEVSKHVDTANEFPDSLDELLAVIADAKPIGIRNSIERFKLAIVSEDGDVGARVFPNAHAATLYFCKQFLLLGNLLSLEQIASAWSLDDEDVSLARERFGNCAEAFPIRTLDKLLRGLQKERANVIGQVAPLPANALSVQEASISRNRERDEMIATLAAEGKSRKEILSAIRKKSSWEQLETPQAVSNVLKRRAKRAAKE